MNPTRFVKRVEFGPEAKVTLDDGSLLVVEWIEVSQGVGDARIMLVVPGEDVQIG